MKKINKVMNLLVTGSFLVGTSFLWAVETNSPAVLTQASGLQGFFRSGQTFLTWNQIPGEKVRYRIYRSDKPIKDFSQLSGEMIVATVNDYTGFNWMGSINRRDIRMASQAGKTYMIPGRINYIIEEGKDVKVMFDFPNIPVGNGQIKIEGFMMDTLIPGGWYGWYGYYNTWGTASGEKGDLVGTVNGEVSWDRTSIIDEPERFAITLNIEDWSDKEKAKQGRGNKYGADSDENTDTTAKRPAATFSDVKYGPDVRNILDLWLAKSDQPTPLVVFIHGGGFTGGSKAGVDTRMINDCLSVGVSVMSINYRYLSESVSLAEIMRDCARSIQFVRFHAKDYNLDPTRVASYGGSAGAGTSLWLAFYPDLADPNNPDPVLRESSRLVAAGAMNPQATYKKQEWESFMGKFNFGGGLADEAETMTREPVDANALAAANDLSMLNLASKDDPPVFLFNSQPDGPPINRLNYVHHPNHVRALKSRCDQVGIPVTVFFTQAEPHSEGDFMAIMENLFFTQFKITPDKITPAR